MRFAKFSVVGPRGCFDKRQPMICRGKAFTSFTTLICMWEVQRYTGKVRNGIIVGNGCLEVGKLGGDGLTLEGGLLCRGTWAHRASVFNLGMILFNSRL